VLEVAEKQRKDIFSQLPENLKCFSYIRGDEIKHQIREKNGDFYREVKIYYGDSVINAIETLSSLPWVHKSQFTL